MANFFEQQRKQQKKQRAEAAAAREVAASEREERRLDPKNAAERSADARRNALSSFKTSLLHSPKSVVPYFAEDRPDKVRAILDEAIQRGTPIRSVAERDKTAKVPVSNNLNHYHYLLNSLRELRSRIEDRSRTSANLSEKEGQVIAGAYDARSVRRYTNATADLQKAQDSLDKHFDAHISGKHTEALHHLIEAASLAHSAAVNANAAATRDRGTPILDDEKNATPWTGMSGPSIKLDVDENGLSFKDRLNGLVDSYKAHLANVAPDNPEVKAVLRQTKFTPTESPRSLPPLLPPTVKKSKSKKPELDGSKGGLLNAGQAYASHLKALAEGKIQPSLYAGEQPGFGAEERFVKAAASAKASGKKLNRKELFNRPAFAPLKFEGAKGTAYDDFLPKQDDKNLEPSATELKETESAVPSATEIKTSSELPKEEFEPQTASMSPDDVRPETGTPAGRIGLSGHFTTGQNAGR